jgi:hypothetical protein
VASGIRGLLHCSPATGQALMRLADPSAYLPGAERIASHGYTS